MSKEEAKPRDSGSSGGPKQGALSVEADEIAPSAKDTKSGHDPNPSPRDSGSSGGPKAGRDMAGKG